MSEESKPIAPAARTSLICPFCGQHEGVFLSTPDYGYGYGAEFAHCCGGERRTWSSKTGEARAISAASRALSRENAAGIDPYKRGFDDGRLAGLRQAAGWVGGTCPNCAAAIRSIADAPKAPKASEVTSDSSALEKALGALREAMVMLELEGDHVEDAWLLLKEAERALSGGAHVDGPKAPKEEVK